MSMPNDQYEDEFEDEAPDESSVIKNLRKQQRETAKELAALREQAERATVLERENNLYKANLGNLNDDQREAILATAKEMTADALRSQAERLGFIAPAEPAVPADELEALDRMNGAASAAPPAGPTYEEEIAGARSEQEVLAIMAKHNSPVAKYD